MRIVLQGSPRYKKRYNISKKMMFLWFIIIPSILLITAIVMLIIHLTRLDDNIIVAVIQVIRDILKTRTGWFFDKGATFSSVYKSNALEYTLRLIPTVMILFFGNFIAEWQCPYCGHFFTMKRISGDRYERTTERSVSNTYYDYSSGMVIDSKGDTYFGGVTTKNKQYGTEVTDYYTHNARCSCCGCVSERSTSKSKTYW